MENGLVLSCRKYTNFDAKQIDELEKMDNGAIRLTLKDGSQYDMSIRNGSNQALPERMEMKDWKEVAELVFQILQAKNIVPDQENSPALRELDQMLINSNRVNYYPSGQEAQHHKHTENTDTTALYKKIEEVAKRTGWAHALDSSLPAVSVPGNANHAPGNAPINAEANAPAGNPLAGANSENIINPKQEVPSVVIDGVDQNALTIVNSAITAEYERVRLDNGSNKFVHANGTLQDGEGLAKALTDDSAVATRVYNTLENNPTFADKKDLLKAQIKARFEDLAILTLKELMDLQITELSKQHASRYQNQNQGTIGMIVNTILTSPAYTRWIDNAYGNGDSDIKEASVRNRIGTDILTQNYLTQRTTAIIPGIAAAHQQQNSGLLGSLSNWGRRVTSFIPGGSHAVRQGSSMLHNWYNG